MKIWAYFKAFFRQSILKNKIFFKKFKDRIRIFFFSKQLTKWVKKGYNGKLDTFMVYFEPGRGGGEIFGAPIFLDFPSPPNPGLSFFVGL